jgi:hypothetical protein
MGGGEALFARYAYPPNELGHCGPPGAELLFAGGDRALVRERAPLFPGAWAYLRLLAAAAGVDDPLHPDVVAAYWLGGDLLDSVDPQTLAALVRDTFASQPGVRDRLAWLPDLAAAGPTHAFHVFVVYPWIGLLGAGDVARSTLDLCRVRWGTVTSLAGDSASVEVRPLTWDGAELGLGAGRPEVCRWARGQDAVVQTLGVGDTVSVHWDWVCDRLDPAALAHLRERTDRQLAATNAWLRHR